MKTDMWSCDEDVEELIHCDVDDAIESHLDGLLEPGMSAADVQKVLPETVMVYGYERLKLDVSRLTERMLEQILEDLDDEYGDPNGGDTKPTTSMKQAAHALVEAIVEDYIVWAHDKVEEHEVDVREWVKTNRPDWLEEAKSD